jgi:branched-chain amino acid transport system permease protein
MPAQFAVALQLLINGVAAGCLYAMMALGFAIIYRATKILLISYGALFAIGGYVYVVASLRLGLGIALGATIIASTTLGLVLFRIIHRPLQVRRTSSAGHMLAALATYSILVNLLSIATKSRPVTSAARALVFGHGIVRLTATQGTSVIISIVAFTFVNRFFRRTDLWLEIRAVHDDPELAGASGIDALSISNYAFALGCALVGVASAIFALDSQIDPNQGFTVVLPAIVAVLLAAKRDLESIGLLAVAIGIVSSLAEWLNVGAWTSALWFGALVAILAFGRRS